MASRASTPARFAAASPACDCERAGPGRAVGARRQDRGGAGSVDRRAGGGDAVRGQRLVVQGAVRVILDVGAGEAGVDREADSFGDGLWCVTVAGFEVAMAGNPASASRTALPATHALGMTKPVRVSCSARKVAA